MGGMQEGSDIGKRLARFVLPFIALAFALAFVILAYAPREKRFYLLAPIALLGVYAAWHDFDRWRNLRRGSFEDRRNDLFSRCIEISNAVVSAIESASLSELVLSRCEGLLNGTGRMAFFQVDPSPGRDAIRPGPQKGFDPEKLARFSFPLDRGTSLVGRAVVQNEIQAILDESSRFWCNQDFINTLDLHRFVVIPFVVPERPLGALLIENEESLPRQYILEALSPLKDQIPVALENHRLYKHVEEISIRDEMTGLHNYRYFRERLQEEVERSRRYRHTLSLAILDIDYFKRFNDEFGHQVGDKALRLTAEVLGNYTRSMAIVARYGGEEFVIVEPEADKEQAKIAVERIRGEITKVEVLTDDGSPTRPLTISAGVAAFPDDGASPDDILRRADEALLYSKQNGRNRVTLAPAPGAA
jgi:diguanylate cyclase (GGDEF)-like protein